MRLIYSWIVLALALSIPEAMAEKPAAGLKTALHFSRVLLSERNAINGNWKREVSCDRFLGTHSGNKISLYAEATGGSGYYRHALIYSLSNGYVLKTDTAGQRQEMISGNGEIRIRLPELRDDVSFVQQTFLLITTDIRTQQTTTTSKTFVVSRPVLLTRSSVEAARTNCFERYRPYEAMSGSLSNGTNNPAQIEIKQGFQKLWSSTRGWQWGVALNPFSLVGLGQLVSLNMSYFTAVSKQYTETTEVATTYTFDPGDYLQVYAQPTRYVDAYDATLVGPCGQTQKLERAYYFQWWGFAYHVYPFNPSGKTPPPIDTIGAPVVNTCPAELTPNSGSEWEFKQTN